MICVDFELGKMSVAEAYTNLREIYEDDDEHHAEVWLKLIEMEMSDETKDLSGPGAVTSLRARYEF
jgi:hypothetical protein